jgi:hypothetical protein
MWPTIRPGQTLVVSVGAVPAPGQVGVFRVAGTGTLVAHRVLAVDADGRFHAQGDRALRADAPWPRASVVGTVVAVETPTGARSRLVHRSLGGLTGAATGAAVRLVLRTFRAAKG